MLWHMLLFGDAFGPAYICYFLVFLHPVMLFFLGVKLQKMLSTGNYPTLYLVVVSGVHSCSVVFNACVYSSMYTCIQSKLSVCIQQYDPV